MLAPRLILATAAPATSNKLKKAAGNATAQSYRDYTNKTNTARRTSTPSVREYSSKPKAATGRAVIPSFRDYKYFSQYMTRWNDNDVYGHLNNVASLSYVDSIVNEYLSEYRHAVFSCRENGGSGHDIITKGEAGLPELGSMNCR